MKRTMIQINTEKCNGCGLCADACHEGAIGMENGKAKLLRDDYCDGLGDCLPVCPTGAITFETREAAAYDKAAVEARQKVNMPPLPCGCPGTQVKTITSANTPASSVAPQPSRLGQWPVQIKLAPIHAPFFENAHLLIAADCTAYAFGAFHEQFMEGRVTLIGCPKLDEGDYAEKLTAILGANTILSVTVVRMEVPCCAGIVRAVQEAADKCGKTVPLHIATISTQGHLL